MEFGKRKRNVLSIDDKLSILSRLDRGAKAAELASEFNVGRSTISDIKSCCHKLQDFKAQFPDTPTSKRRKVMRSAADGKLETAVYTWFVQERSKGSPISGPIIMEKAVMFDRMMNGPDTTFKATTGWFQRFKDRHGIRQLEVQGEALSADTSQIDEFRAYVRELQERECLKDCQVYNADETGLYWKVLPNKTLTHAIEKSAPGH